MSFVVPVKDTQRMEYQLPPPPVSAPNPLAGHQVPVGVMQGTLTHVQAQTQDESHRWTYQQLWRQHVYMNGTDSLGSFAWAFHPISACLVVGVKLRFIMKYSFIQCNSNSIIYTY